MKMSKKYFNIYILYVLLWILYLLQGMLYASGSIISQALLAIIFVLSIYYAGIVNITKERLPIFIKVLNIFLVMLTLYGIFAMIDPTPLYIDNYLEEYRPKYHFLKTAYMSLLPIYAFYYFHIKGIMTDDSIRTVTILLLVVTTCIFSNHRSEMLIEAWSEGSKTEDITNNIAYNFLQLLPLVYLWNKKPLVQYIYVLYIIMFLIAGMKRGAIFIGALCFIQFIYRTWKTSKGKQRILITFLSIVIIIFGVNYISDFYATNEYFQHRIEQTADGDSSGRDELLMILWNHFVNDTSTIHAIFGNGAMQTIRIAGNYAHNDWFEFLICHGILGIVVYIAYFIALIRCWWASKTKPMIHNMLEMTIIIMFLSTLFSMSYNNLFIGITMALGYSLSHQQGYSS